MSYAYAQRKKAAPSQAPASESPARMDALRSGAVKPTAAEMGHRVDLPEQMRARMEFSFGADLSAVKLYESRTVADAGAEAVTQGNSIAFAPGKADFSSRGGQELLGHELSHVVSQQRGEVTGGGFLNDHALEARADRDGAMAAAGESVYGGAVAPLSGASATAAAGPMQAKRDKSPKGSPELITDEDRVKKPYASGPFAPWKEYFRYDQIKKQKRVRAKLNDMRGQLLEQGRDEEAGNLSEDSLRPGIAKGLVKLPGKLLKYGAMPVIQSLKERSERKNKRKYHSDIMDRADADTAMANSDEYDDDED